MKTKVFLAIVIRIVILFSVAMIGTFLSEYLSNINFFGDKLVASGRYEGDIDWGARHYWYFWMIVVLFLTALMNVIVGVANIIKKNYDTSKW